MVAREPHQLPYRRRCFHFSPDYNLPSSAAARPCQLQAAGELASLRRRPLPHPVASRPSALHHTFKLCWSLSELGRSPRLIPSTDRRSSSHDLQGSRPRFDPESRDHAGSNRRTQRCYHNAARPSAVTIVSQPRHASRRRRRRR